MSSLHLPQIDALASCVILDIEGGQDQADSGGLSVEGADVERLEVVRQVLELGRDVVLVVRGLVVVERGVVLLHRAFGFAGVVDGGQERTAGRLGGALWGRERARGLGLGLAEDALLHPVLRGDVEADFARKVASRMQLAQRKGTAQDRGTGRRTRRRRLSYFLTLDSSAST